MNRAITAIAAVLLSSGLAAQQEFFSESGEFSENGDPSANRHTIAVEAGKTVEVIVIGEGVDTVVNATLPNGDTLVNDDYQDINAGFVRTFEQGGEVEIVASALMGGSGSYRVVARTLPSPGTIEIGQTVEGQLDDASGGGDRYQLVGSADTRVVIDLKSYDFDAFLTVVDSEGNERTDDDGGDEGLNSRLYHQFEADGETITITAGTFGSSTGRYQLSVTELSSEAAAQYDGRLDNDSARAYNGKRYESFEFEGEAGETLTIELKSNAFDAMLYVSRPDGSNLVSDDDGGDGTNSMAVTTLPETGTYTIHVTSLADSQGEFELTIFK
ncbi:PPC domain-containing protein [Wenzhouxiangella sp. EGI_FJ10409]|uniref:PPC domain-containing protein n=1 Tax=Wenzhouxiangella sp. EGI_FJ10409 TaxID=3243767 RepID=UPI0035D9B4BF